MTDDELWCENCQTRLDLAAHDAEVAAKARREALEEAAGVVMGTIYENAITSLMIDAPTASEAEPLLAVDGRPVCRCPGDDPVHREAIGHETYCPRSNTKATPEGEQAWEKTNEWSLTREPAPRTAAEREAAYWAGPGCEEDDRG